MHIFSLMSKVFLINVSLDRVILWDKATNMTMYASTSKEIAWLQALVFRLRRKN